MTVMYSLEYFCTVVNRWCHHSYFTSRTELEKCLANMRVYNDVRIGVHYFTNGINKSTMYMYYYRTEEE